MVGVDSVSTKCRECIRILRDVISRLSDQNKTERQTLPERVQDELDKFSLWLGNIGALHDETSPLSLESRLRQDEEVLAHIKRLLDDHIEVSAELLRIVSNEEPETFHFVSEEEDAFKADDEASELIEEVAECTRHLFQMSKLIRQAASTDIFTRALTRDRYRFNEQFDINHVGEKYSKLAEEGASWLRVRLGKAITHRRQYLSYVQDHRDKLQGSASQPAFQPAALERDSEPSHSHNLVPGSAPLSDPSSHPSTFITKASSVIPGYISTEMLINEDISDQEDDARSYTTISRSVDLEFSSSIVDRIPPLETLRQGVKGEVECPFCFRMRRFRNEKRWKQHVFSDLRTYVCTSRDCDGPYFENINDWFRHEMENHLVDYACPICRGIVYQHKDDYLSHVRRKHPALWSASDKQRILEITRQPMKDIPVRSCPCCDEWQDRIRQREATTEDAVICVTQKVFKRHLASHLEALSLFAIPIGPSDDQDTESNEACEDKLSSHSHESNLSALTFGTQPSATALGGSTGLGDQRKLREEDVATINSITGLKRERLNEHHDRVSELKELASRHRDEWRLEEEADLLGQVLEMRRQVLGDEHPDTILAMTGLASNLRDQGRLEEAVELMEKIVDDHKRLKGHDHSMTLAATKDLASTLEEYGELRKAIALLEDVSRLQRDLSVEDYPNRLETQSQLARAYIADDQLQKAISLLEHMVRVQEVLPRDHPDRFTYQYQLAKAYITGNQPAEGTKLLRNLIAMQQRTVSPDHSDLLALQHYLAEALYRDGQSAEAIRLLRDMLEVQKERLGEDHLDLLTSQQHLGIAFCENGQFTRAIKLLEQVISIQKRVMFQDDSSLLLSQTALAKAYLADHRLAEAVKLLCHVVKVQQATLSKDDADLLASQHQLGEALYCNNQFPEAVKLLEEVVSIKERVMSPDNHSLLLSSNALARAYKADGQTQKAENLLSLCVKIEHQTMEPTGPIRIESERLLEQLDRPPSSSND